MATIISTKTTGGGGASITGDTSGILQLASADGTTAVTIDASQNVGIGTATTSAKLKIAGTTANSLANLGTEDAATCVINNIDVGGLNRLSKTLYEIASLSVASVSGVYTNFNGSNDIGGALVFGTQTNASGGVIERMRIDSSGNTTIATGSLTVAAGYSYNGFNANGAYPLSGGYGSQCWNFSAGGGEVNYWNSYSSASTSFIWRQLTGVSTSTFLMSLSPTGNLFVGGTTQNTATAPVYAGNTAKAWVNFNGVTTATIRASFNVSSVTYNSVGDYTVNFTNALVDANYSVTTMANANYGVDRSCHPSIFTNISAASESTPTTTAFKVGFCNGAGNSGEALKYICVAVFR